jgi:hypothetical protein
VPASSSTSRPLEPKRMSISSCRACNRLLRLSSCRMPPSGTVGTRFQLWEPGSNLREERGGCEVSSSLQACPSSVRKAQFEVSCFG